MKRRIIDLSAAQLRRERACRGISAGWFLEGLDEVWYPRKVCETRRDIWRWLLGHPCVDCARAFHRRGFRINYDMTIREK